MLAVISVIELIYLFLFQLTSSLSLHARQETWEPFLSRKEIITGQTMVFEHAS